MSIPVPEDTKQNKPTKFSKDKITIPEKNPNYKVTVSHPSGNIPEQVDPIQKYGGITLNFGKYSGKLLKEIAVEDPNYLKWLKQRFEKDENSTPTMKAIIRFANAV